MPLAYRIDAARNVLFKDCAEMYFEANKSAWKNKKHTQQFTNTFKTYVYPVIGDLPVQGITVDLVLKVLRPIWEKIPETANRTRSRITAGALSATIVDVPPEFPEKWDLADAVPVGWDSAALQELLHTHAALSEPEGASATPTGALYV